MCFGDDRRAYGACGFVVVWLERCFRDVYLYWFFGSLDHNVPEGSRAYCPSRLRFIRGTSKASEAKAQ